MRTVGFPISKKENERRRALLPVHIDRIKNKELIYIETGYGDVLNYTDHDYIAHGVNICSRAEVLKKDIICDPKIGDAEYLGNLTNQTIFGWVHAVQNREITDILVSKRLSAYAWEDMFRDGRHIFYRNNEIAGEAAIMHAFLLHGLFPYETKVAVIGRGNIAQGAIKILTRLGADITIYNRNSVQILRKEISFYDVIVNAILWDTTRTDHIIYKEDLKRMKKGALIIDISCDKNGGVATSVPTSIQDPIYEVDGITHYVVDHTPAMFYKTISTILSDITTIFIDELIECKIDQTLQDALIIQDGVIIDARINEFQGR